MKLSNAKVLLEFKSQYNILVQKLVYDICTMMMTLQRAGYLRK